MSLRNLFNWRSTGMYAVLAVVGGMIANQAFGVPPTVLFPLGIGLVIGYGAGKHGSSGGAPSLPPPRAQNTLDA